ncbi:dTMP kinase [Benzoatithermus flavus]|uniref:Thymidylate kinase n=1 Tax=Benzoatithermus flavus TaxID=3108223 RepID=A0ABU8XLN1_9PROT
MAERIHPGLSPADRDSRQRGRFITLEGGEGAGKSTQAKRLAHRLEALGLELLLTREPGGTEGAEAIRELIVHGPADRWRPLTELYLFLAARDDHLERAILPALKRGVWVVCDRFADSSRVYQGYAGEVGLETVDALHAPLLVGHEPDLTLLLDLPVEVGMARCSARSSRAGQTAALPDGSTARFEAKDRTYHERVREGFLMLAAREAARFVVIDAAKDEEQVAEAIWRAVTSRFGLAAS